MASQNMKNSLSRMLLRKEHEVPDVIYLRQPKNGVWHEYSWAQVVLKARKVAAFLQNQGLKRGSHVSIISKNCAEWFITDFGITLAGMVNVPLFHNQYKDSIQYVLEHGDVAFVFIGKLDDHETVRGYIPEKYPTASFGYHDDLKTSFGWDAIESTEPLVDVIHAEPEELFTIIYSSGTTGNPKGAMYTHQSIANYLTLFEEDILRIRKLPLYHLVSYLPLAHVYERSALELGSIMIPSQVSFIEALDKFTDNLKTIQPDFFTAVPRIWGVFKQKIEHKLPANRLKILSKIPLISTLIRNKVKREIGMSRCVNFFSGASQLPESITSFFRMLGITIQEGYGQTENLAYATLALLGELRDGYVGTARLGVELRVSDEQELLVKSPCLMSGYYKNEEASKASFTPDGWLKTGDIVEMDPQGRVKILGRISENFKNQTGEFVAPTPIESLFLKSDIIAQICLVGRGLPTNVLIITLSEKAKLSQSKAQIKQRLQALLGRVNGQLKKFDKVSHILIVKEEWTTQNNLLTPTLKVKRRVIEEQFQPLIQTALSHHVPVIWEDDLREG